MIGKAIMAVEMAGLQWKWAMMVSNESTLPGLSTMIASISRLPPYIIYSVTFDPLMYA